MKVATLVHIRRGDKLLLGEKKKGEIGKGVIVGPGGKQEAGESLTGCLLREVREELGIFLDEGRLRRVGIIVFFAAGVPDFETHVYETDYFTGEPRETNDMIPRWFDVAELPYERMFESDRHFLPRLLAGEKIQANVYYRNRAGDFDHIDFFVPSF